VVFLLTPGSFLSLHSEWGRKKGEGKDQGCHDCEYHPFSTQRFNRFDDSGVAEAEEEQDHRPGKPAIPEVSQGQQDQEETARKPSVSVAQDGVEDMSAVELAHRQQVQRGRK